MTNNLYPGDGGVVWHDIGCHLKTSFLCEDSDLLLGIANDILKIIGDIKVKRDGKMAGAEFLQFKSNIKENTGGKAETEVKLDIMKYRSNVEVNPENNTAHLNRYFPAKENTSVASIKTEAPREDKYKNVTILLH